MMDGFDKKRQMVKVLQDMLKHSASEEVTGKKGLPQTTPVGPDVTARHDDTPDMAKQTKSTMPHPHVTDLTQTNPLQQKTSDSSMMAKGGMVDLSKPHADLMQPASNDKCMAHGGMLPEHGPDCHYAEGGLAGTDMSASDEPNRLLEPKAESDGDNGALGILPEAPQDEQGQEASRQTLANENMEHEDEDNNSSSFEGFFSRPKRKK
jgi:hypothetical protein